jgi:outer membrane usher protein FimD/PapC
VTSEPQSWGYDFDCDQSIESLLAAFNAAGPWVWRRRDSDIYGYYLRCEPGVRAEAAVYRRSQFWTWRTGDRDGFYSALYSEPEARTEIDRVFCSLLQSTNATNIIAN